MSMGKGDIVNILRKHKINVASSTELELVSIADVLGMVMWCKYFMEAQGYTIENNIFIPRQQVYHHVSQEREGVGWEDQQAHQKWFLTRY